MESNQPTAPLPGKRKSLLKLILLPLAAALGITLALIVPWKIYIPDAVAWIQSLGAWGPVIFIVLYVLACLLFLPAWILTVGAGFIFGLGWGAAWVSLGATLGCLAAFVVGRTWARAPITRWVGQHPRWSALDQVLAERGFVVVFLLRLSPVFPFSLLNYVLGLTRVRLGTFVAASWLGMLPGLFMYVYLGTAVHSLTDLAARRIPVSPAQTIFLWVGLAATALVVVLVTRLAGRRLKIPAS